MAKRNYEKLREILIKRNQKSGYMRGGLGGLLRRGMKELPGIIYVLDPDRGWEHWCKHMSELTDGALKICSLCINVTPKG